jgi:hypothetical protein
VSLYSRLVCSKDVHSRTIISRHEVGWLVVSALVAVRLVVSTLIVDSRLMGCRWIASSLVVRKLKVSRLLVSRLVISELVVSELVDGRLIVGKPVRVVNKFEIKTSVCSCSVVNYSLSAFGRWMYSKTVFVTTILRRLIGRTTVFGRTVEAHEKKEICRNGGSAL